MSFLKNIRYKTRVGILLTTLLVCLLLNNIINQENYKNIEKAATSIYEDRLLPSAYIFEIREYLYKGKALYQHTESKEHTEARARYNAAIMQLIDKYEHTILTKAENAELVLLKSNLDMLLFSSQEAHVKEAYFTKSLDNLNNLLHIQTGEGRHLKTDMANIVHTSTFLSYLEICLLIVIGGLTLSLIGFSKNIFQAPQKPSLN